MFQSQTSFLVTFPNNEPEWVIRLGILCSMCILLCILKISTHLFANVTPLTRSVMPVNNCTMGFLHSTVSTKVTEIKFHKYFCCFFLQCKQLCQGAQTFSLTHADVVQVTIWCLLIKILHLFKVLPWQIFRVFSSPFGNQYTLTLCPEGASSSIDWSIDLLLLTMSTCLPLHHLQLHKNTQKQMNEYNRHTSKITNTKNAHC